MAAPRVKSYVLGKKAPKHDIDVMNLVIKGSSGYFSKGFISSWDKAYEAFQRDGRLTAIVLDVGFSEEE